MEKSIDTNPLIKKFSSLLELNDQEKKLLFSLQDSVETLPAKTDIVKEGEQFPATYIIQDGWAYHYKLLDDGRQQVLNYSIRGDFIGLHSTLVNQAEHSISSLTDLTVSKTHPEQVMRLFSETPRLAAAICWLSVRESSLLAEQVTRIGRRSAYERTAHLILELLRRLEAVGLSAEGSYEFPISQELIADTLGLTPVHTNRTFRSLKKDGLIDYTSNTMIVVNRPELRKVAGFDPAYLQQPTLPEDLSGPGE